MSLFEDTNPKALKELLAEINSRTMALPDFQRDFVWEPGATPDLIISIANDCRLIVSENEISGLVSLSDLQRLPVRAALFGLITYLEIVMAKLIRQEFSSTKTGSTDFLKVDDSNFGMKFSKHEFTNP